MTNSGYDSSHPTAKNHAQGYTYSENGYEPIRFVDMSVAFSAGALYSTVLDLYKWDQAVKASKLIPKNSLDEMLTGHIAVGEAPSTDSAVPNTDSEGKSRANSATRKSGMSATSRASDR